MTKRMLTALLVAAVLTMTGCWEAFGRGFAQRSSGALMAPSSLGYHGGGYQPAYYYHEPLPGPYHSRYYPTPKDHYWNDYFGIDDGFHHQQHHHY